MPSSRWLIESDGDCLARVSVALNYSMGMVLTQPQSPYTPLAQLTVLKLGIYIARRAEKVE